jgi:hypothetical protein
MSGKIAPVLPVTFIGLSQSKTPFFISLQSEPHSTKNGHLKAYNETEKTK